MKFKPRRKHLYIILALFGLFLSLSFGIGYWLKSSIPIFLKEKNDTAYDVKFETVDYSLLKNQIEIKGIDLLPKEKQTEELSLDFKAHIGSLKIMGVNFIELMKNRNISASLIQLENADVEYYKTSVKDTVIEPTKLGTSIHVSNFKIKNSDFKMYDLDRKTNISNIANVNIEINGVNLSQATLKKKIPFTYQTYEISFDSLFLLANPAQKLKSKHAKVNNNSFQLNDFQIINIDSLIHKPSIEKRYRLLPEIKTPSVLFTGMDWEYQDNDNVYFNAKTLKFDSLDIRISKNRYAEPEKIEKSNRGGLIPIELDIDRVLISDAQLEIPDDLKVENINLEIINIKNQINDELSIDKVSLNKPIITSYLKHQNKKNKSSQSTIDFVDNIRLKELEIIDAEYRLNEHPNGQNVLKINDFNLAMQTIEINPKTIVEKIPFEYKDLKIDIASVDYHPKSVYHLTTGKVTFNNGKIDLNNFQMKPKVSRRQFVNSLKKEKDLYDLSAEHIGVSNLDFGYQGQDLYFKTPNVAINKADANIFRSKIPPDDTSKKPMYNKLLRELPFIMEVKQVDLKNSKVVYEEETVESSGAGKLTFNNFNAKITNVYSGFRRKSTPDVRSEITTDFMDESKLTAIWTFNPMNRTEKFNMKGSIYNFDAEKMDPFVKPYLHATATGNLTEVRYNFTGNDISATGDFGIKYDHLKVTLYNKKTGKPRKFISSIGNLAIKSNTKDEYKEVKIKTVERKQDRSFFNFFWLCVQQGLKETILII